MTREEAIIQLRLGPGINEDVSEKYNDAVNMAIEALEGVCFDEWCTDCKEYDTEKKCCPRFNRVIREALKREPSEDLISRAQVAEIFEAMLKTVTDQKIKIGISRSWQQIKDLPSADRPRGHWIDMADFEQCSECRGTHLKEVDTYYGKAIWIKTDFCPNCGADMRGEDE